MKNTLKVTTFILLMSALSACSVKSTSSKVSTTTTSPIGTTTGSNGTNGSTGTNGTNGSNGDSGGTGNSICQEVIEGKCYRKVPNIQASGGSYGQTWWSSANYTASGTGLSPNMFATDAVFNVRIIARSPTPNATSTFGRKCMDHSIAKKVKVQFMLHKQGVTVGDVGTVASAAFDTVSGVYKFAVPKSEEPLVLEVVNVLSDSRCTGVYGSTKQYDCANNPYYDIPIQTNTAYPTECVAFDILYSTDETWSLQ